MVVLLKGVDVPFFLGFGTKLSVLDNLWVKVTIYGEINKLICMKFYFINENTRI